MKHILVADDEFDIAEGIREALGSEHQVDVATSGLQSLVLFKKNKYDAVILDIDFGPGMTGLEIADAIRKENQTIPILIFSAIDYSDSVRRQTVDLGATFREKPLKVVDILKFLEEQP